MHRTISKIVAYYAHIATHKNIEHLQRYSVKLEYIWIKLKKLKIVRFASSWYSVCAIVFQSSRGIQSDCLVVYCALIDRSNYNTIFVLRKGKQAKIPNTESIIICVFRLLLYTKNHIEISIIEIVVRSSFNDNQSTFVSIHGRWRTRKINDRKQKSKQVKTNSIESICCIEIE